MVIREHNDGSVTVTHGTVLQGSELPSILDPVEGLNFDSFESTEEPEIANTNPTEEVE